MYRFNRMGNFWTNILKKKINYRHNEVKKKNQKKHRTRKYTTL